MDNVLENITAMVEQHPAGILLKNLTVLYQQTYHCNPCLSSLGFDAKTKQPFTLIGDLVVEGKRVFHKTHYHARKAGSASMDDKDIKMVLEKLVSMVKQKHEGIPVKKLAVAYKRTYGETLKLSTLGFKTMASLVASLDRDLVVEGEQVFHKDHLSGRQEAAEPAAAAGSETTAKTTEDSEAILQNVVALIEEYPHGIPLKLVAPCYHHKYHQQLALAPLGFKSISALVASREIDLVLKDQLVFHTIHQPQNPTSTPSATPALPKASSHQVAVTQAGISPLDTSSLSTAPLITTHGPAPDSLVFAASKPSQQLTQQQLHQRVLEVMTKFQLSAPTIKKLKTFYFRQFGEELPLAQYMSLYDNWQASASMNPPSQDAAANPNTVASQTAAATEPEKNQQQPASTLDFLSSTEFPQLGSDMSLSKAQKKDAAPRGGTAPVFNDAYHAQLREVHGGNVRAVETLEGNGEATAGRRWNRSVDLDSVNNLMKSVIREIAAEGELVTEEKVISRACGLMQISSLKDINIKPWNVQALKDLRYVIREINMFIESSEAVNSICTLYELGQSLAGLKDKKCFEELNLGPLCKLPLIHRMFKIESNTRDDDIHQIKTVDILKHLREFRKLNCRPKVDLAEFLKYLADHYNCDSPYELGIRIHSVGLPIATLMKVSRSEHATMTQAREVIQRELEEETHEQLRKRKRSVLEPLQGAGSFSSQGSLDLRKKYVSMTAAEVVLAVFSNAEGVFSPRMTKHVQNFLLQVSGDRLATALFQLAICGGSLAVPQDLVPKDRAPQTTEKNTKEDKVNMSRPSEAKVKQFLKDSLSSQNSAITLAHIASLERKLTKHFQVKDFLSLEQGNFLDFLVKHSQLLQDTLGSSLIVGSCSGEHAGNGLRPTKQDVIEFIQQCGNINSTDPDEISHIEAALRSHYSVRDSRDLGHGSLQTLVGLVQRLKGLDGGGVSQVLYETALFSKQGKPIADAGCEAVGCLGEMSNDQAVASLLSCPLLEDLSEWSQWELIFKPLHGSLKDFIVRHAANTGLAALEVRPGLLLRITTHTGDKNFSSSAMALDPIGAAGHLVSMVAADGVDNAPTALLANHMQTSLAAAVAKEGLSQDENDVACYSRVAQFLLACLMRIPSRMGQALLKQVFLEPFSRVLGQTKSKQVLITLAQSDPRSMNCLHRLGILLGITDWTKDYLKKLNPTQTHGFNTAPVEPAKSNLIDSGSSSLSALNMSEDDYFEDNGIDTSFASSQLNQSLHQVNGEGDVEAEEDEEELFEFAPAPEVNTSDAVTEAEGVQEKENSEMSDSNESDADECQAETTLSPQRLIIEDIRKNEFGIGMELTAESQKLMQIQQDRLGRSLERLSTELYSKDTHFVLELIQNADDNTYPSDAGIIPSLAFVVERDCVTVLNNEIGFQEKNIRAICDVGRSTKGKHKYGYIGQKGIGFKSVFKITDRPEIHSNGFHLCFDKTCGASMGYILPYWTDDERPLDLTLTNTNPISWTTKICLPLRPESHQTRNLFHDVHPSLLLFLHRLRSLTIYNQSENRLVTMTRKDLSHDVVEVEHTEGLERWLVVKTMLHPKKIKEDVESTELALAFQLGSDAAGDEVVCQPQKQPVFAYLPLRSFGFRFIVQGDFDIPSSREDVDRDSSWNQWLRSEIPQLFLQAMDVFTDHPEFRGLKGLCQFLQFIPLPDEVLDFFKPVAGQIIQLLKGKAFLPTLGSDGKVVYKLPSQVAVCQDAVIREVIGADELERHLSLSYLHMALSPAPPASLLTHLGVRYLRGSHVTTVTTAMAKELVREEAVHSDGGLRQLARLLVCNFRALEYGYGEADALLENLRELPIIPLADGSVVALNGAGVFFPMEETQNKKKGSQLQPGPLSALYKDVKVVHPSLLSCVEPLESQQVRELLKRLGVHELEPQQLLEQHIYPTIRSNKWKSKPDAVVVSYLVFIKQHSTSSQEDLDVAVPVLTSKGLLCPGVDKIHFSEEYGNINLPQTLPGHDWVLLSPCYVETDRDLAGWRELFSRLGVRDGLIIRKERQTLTSKDLASSPWSAESAMWPLRAGESIVLDDFPCEEFHALATAQISDFPLLQQRAALLRLLATNWETGHKYSQYLTAQVIDSDGRPVKNTNSSFYYSLCRLEWVPAYRPLEGGKLERKYLSPSSVYLTSPEVTRLLGTHVYYVENIDASDFSRALGMRQSVSVDTLINFLKEWCLKPVVDDQEQRSPEDESEGANFETTVQHIHSVYSYLHTNCPQSSLKELFQHNPAVFIEYDRRDDDWCSGRFYHLKEVCWRDPTSMFRRYKPLTHKPDSGVQEPKVLAPFYNPLDGMRDFFIRLLNVDHDPNMNQYVGLLELICSSSPIPTNEVLQDVSVLYARLAQKCKMPVSGEQEHSPQPNLNSSYCSTLKGMVSDMRVFPTKDNTWVSLARKPMIADNKELEKIFKPHPQVCLLNLPPAEKAAPKNKTGNGERANSVPTFNERDRSLFMEICRVRPLSQCVKTEPQTESLRPCPSMQAMVHSVMPYIQRFLYRHEELADLYSDLVENNIREKIKRLQFCQVGKLYIRYQLDVADSDEALVEMQDVICLLKDEKELYIQKDNLSAHLDICRELVKLFCTESSHRKELMHFLSSLITSLDDPKALKRLLLKEDVKELPSGEEQWEVPEPPKPDMNLERVLSRSFSSNSTPEEPPRPPQDEGDKTLVCWPPRAPMQNTGSSRTGQTDGVVDTIMKMWPPPACPKDRGPEREGALREAGPVPPHGPSSEGPQPLRSSVRPPDQPPPQRALSHPGQTHPAAAPPSISTAPPPPPGTQRRPQTETTDGAEGGASSITAPSPAEQTPPSAQPAETASDQGAANGLAVPDAVVLTSVFQGTADAYRPPLNLDFPLWNKAQPPQATLEDMTLTCQRPTTVVLSDDGMDVAAIGEWGEQLVNSFLCHWRDSGDHSRPTHIQWCNQGGESGQPYDFKLSFGAAGEAGVVYVEVKSTIKKEKSFIHLSANELDFALKEKERYHIYRVYSAGDASKVRLCRIRNLAQHLHTKDLALYLFV